MKKMKLLKQKLLVLTLAMTMVSIVGCGDDPESIDSGVLSSSGSVSEDKKDSQDDKDNSVCDVTNQSKVNVSVVDAKDLRKLDAEVSVRRKEIGLTVAELNREGSYSFSTRPGMAIIIATADGYKTKSAVVIFVSDSCGNIVQKELTIKLEEKTFDLDVNQQRPLGFMPK